MLNPICLWLSVDDLPVEPSRAGLDQQCMDNLCDVLA